ncbi:hypothetical protein KGQ19_15530 [Catenulispora sp. NL8]|uniref:Integral membrane protein n=1 Tax=Catenulispora pinistramenti TaxID=2705254 RepID=A0ABS5KQJ7_9ACTN|nr:mannosyltransferase family protein [Catenulispora pinistramenti]MBS2548275.1 hypothetical protein [Catenulispora pinistramenti]
MVTGVEIGSDEAHQGSADPDTTAGGGYARWRGRLKAETKAALYGPIAVYVAAHAVVVGLFAWSIAHQGGRFWFALSSWDADWYARVAAHGYEHQLQYSPDGRIEQMRIAFFPLLPALERLIARPTGMDPHHAGILVIWLSSVAAAVGIHAVLKGYLGHRAALVAVALWAAAPPSIYESMGYSESLFTAASAWAVWALLRRRWITAAAFTVAAGLCRSTAVTLIGLVCLLALIEAVRGRNWRAMVAVVLAPMGFIGYMVYLGIRTGHFDAWFRAEKAPYWESSFDFGKSTWDSLRGLAGFDGADRGEFLATALVGAVVVFGIVALYFVVRDRRLPWELVAWTVISVLFSLLTGGGFSSKARFLLPYFVLWAPFATWFARSRTSSVVLGVAVIALVGGWYGAYFLGPANHMSP